MPTYERVNMLYYTTEELVGPLTNAPLIFWSMPSNSIAFVQVAIAVIRPSTGACRAWSLEALNRHRNGQNTENIENIPAPPNQFGNTADETELSGATISFGVRLDEAGVNVNVPNGMTLVWTAMVSGFMVREIP